VTRSGSHGATSPSTLHGASPRAFAPAQLLDALGTSVALVDTEWRIVYVNPAWEALTALTAAEFVGRTIWEAFPQFGDAPEAEAVRATMADGVPRRYRIAYRDERLQGTFGVEVRRAADGHLVFELRDESQSLLEAKATAFAAMGEETVALRALAQQMAEIADTGELLALLCHTAVRHCDASGAIVVQCKDDEGEVMAATGIMSETRGTRFPIAGSFIEELITSRRTVAADQLGASRRPFARALGRASEGEGVGPVLMAPLVAYDQVVGVLAVYRSDGAPPFGGRETEQLRVIAAHASLVVSKSLLLVQARAADQAKGRFLATMSHELRTPLTALAGYGELLTDEILGPLSEAQSDVLGRMQSVTHHLTVMIEEVLTYSSLEAGREMVRPVEVLASDLVHASLAVVEPLAREKGLALEHVLTDPALRLVTDIDKLRQILVNLLGNAVKFTNQGVVRLVARREDDEVHFRVEDSGVGIAPGDLSRLFQPFQQLDAGLTRRHGGTGLGLYISHRLASLLRGRVRVESTLGVGSTFTLTVPLRFGE